jgi:hypothetical protein
MESRRMDGNAGGGDCADDFEFRTSADDGDANDDDDDDDGIDGVTG